MIAFVIRFYYTPSDRLSPGGIKGFPEKNCRRSSTIDGNGGWLTYADRRLFHSGSTGHWSSDDKRSLLLEKNYILGILSNHLQNLGTIIVRNESVLLDKRVRESCIKIFIPVSRKGCCLGLTSYKYFPKSGGISVVPNNRIKSGPAGHWEWRESLSTIKPLNEEFPKSTRPNFK